MVPTKRFSALGERADRLSGDRRSGTSSSYHPKETISGTAGLALRTPRRAVLGGGDAGRRTARPASPDYKWIDWYREHPVDDDLKLLKWSDDQCDGRAHRRLAAVRSSAARPGRDRRLGQDELLAQPAAAPARTRGARFRGVDGAHRAQPAAAGAAAHRGAPLGADHWRIRFAVGQQRLAAGLRDAACAGAQGGARRGLRDRVARWRQAGRRLARVVGAQLDGHAPKASLLAFLAERGSAPIAPSRVAGAGAPRGERLRRGPSAGVVHTELRLRDDAAGRVCSRGPAEMHNRALESFAERPARSRSVDITARRTRARRCGACADSVGPARRAQPHRHQVRPFGVGACGACTVHDRRPARRARASTRWPRCRAVRVHDHRGARCATARRTRCNGRGWARTRCACRYCQSGMLMAAAALLQAKPDPTDAEIDAAVTNLCRCGTYQRVRDAIRSAGGDAARAKAGGAPASRARAEQRRRHARLRRPQPRRGAWSAMKSGARCCFTGLGVAGALMVGWGVLPPRSRIGRGCAAAGRRRGRPQRLGQGHARRRGRARDAALRDGSGCAHRARDAGGRGARRRAGAGAAVRCRSGRAVRQCRDPGVAAAVPPRRRRTRARDAPRAARNLDGVQARARARHQRHRRFFERCRCRGSRCGWRRPRRARSCSVPPRCAGSCQLDELAVRDGVVSHSSGVAAHYGELATQAAATPPAASA